MKNKIFILNGLPRAGKDTFVQMIREEYEDISKGRVVYHTSVVNGVKELEKLITSDLYKSLSTNSESIKFILEKSKQNKDDRYRKFLSDLKDITEEYCDYWFLLLSDEMRRFNMDFNESIVFIDAREPKDIARLKKVFGADSVYVINDNLKHIADNHADKAATLDNYNYDYVIDNSSDFKHLRKVAKDFINIIF